MPVDTLRYEADMRQLNAALADLRQGQVQAQQDTQAQTEKMGGHWRALATGMGIAVGEMVTNLATNLAGKAVSFIGDSITAASDLGETISKVNQIFGADTGGSIQEWAKNAAESMGQSTQQALDASATFATFGKAAGLSGSALGDFAKQNTALASDLASFNNTSPEEAIQAIGSALRGEAEPIRKYGILLDDATLRNQALKMGLISSVKDALTPANKTLAAQAAILAQTGDAQGDFARTSDGLANSSRIMSAKMADMKTEIGQGLLPIVLRITEIMSTYFLPAIKAVGLFLVDKLSPIFGEIVGGVRALIAAFAAGDGEVTSGGFAGTMERIGGVLRVLYEEVFVRVKEAFMSFTGAFSAGNGDVTSSGFNGTMEKVANVLRAVWDFLSSVDWGGLFGQLVDAMKPIVESVGKDLVAWWGFLYSAALTAFNLIKDNWDTITKIADIIKNALTTAVDGAKAAIDLLSTALNWLSDHMGAVKAVVIPLTAAFVAYKVVTLAIEAAQWIATTATAAWTAAQTLLNGAMTLNPIGIVVALIAGLVVGVIYAYTHFEAFRNVIQSVWDAIQAAFHWVADNWPLILEILTGPFGLAEHIIRANWDSIYQGFSNIVGWIQTGISAVVGFVTAIPGRIGAVASTAFHALQDGFGAAKDWIGARIEEIVGWVGGLGARIGSVARGMWDGITNAFKTAINTIIRGWNAIQFKIPGFHIGPIGFDGFTLGLPDIPTLDKGGIVQRPSLAFLAQNSVPEIVSPIPQLRAIVREESGGAHVVQNFNYTLHGATALTPKDIARAQADAAFRLRVGAA